MTAHRLKDGLSPGRILSGILDGRELLAQLPGDLRRLVNRLSEGDWSLELKPRGVDEVVAALRQAANRVAAGLVLAALIVGAALMMRVETEFSVLEYPGLAMAFFLAAAAGGAVLLWSIYRQDR